MEQLSAQALAGAGKQIGRRVDCLEQVDSTNLYLKALADQGAPHGTVATARVQTGGLGRQGRSFHSPEGKGLYLSVLLRPQVSPQQATHLTAWVALAAARAVEAACGLRPDVKWVNDLQIEGKKLSGILCQMGTDGNGEDYVIAGIGINVSHTPEDFPPQVAPLATSLARHLPCPPGLTALARALIGELDRMSEDFPHRGEEYLAEYRRRCVTLGQWVEFSTSHGPKEGLARDVDSSFHLEVVLPGGEVMALSAGEVSARVVDKGGVGAV